MNYADEIKEAITMRDVCDRYGLEVSRHGFMCCPFHSEDTPSLKIYDGSRGFCCFGCGESGSVIDFVMKFFGIGFYAAQKRLNDDFQLGLPIGERLSLREHRQREDELRKRREKQEARRRERAQLEAAYDLALDEYARLDRQRMQYKPDLGADSLHPLFLAAIHEIGYAEYLLNEAESRLLTYETG